MAQSLRPCPQCGRMMDASRSQCVFCAQGSASAAPVASHVAAPGQDQPVSGSQPKGSSAWWGVALIVVMVAVYVVAPIARTFSAPRPTVEVRADGPAFSVMQAGMGYRDDARTQAQRQAYWRSVAGTLVVWTGELRDASLTGDGSLQLRCDPRNGNYDVEARMDGSQSQMLLSLAKGQPVTVQGVLTEETFLGYRVMGARIVSDPTTAAASVADWQQRLAQIPPVERGSFDERRAARRAARQAESAERMKAYEQDKRETRAWLEGLLETKRGTQSAR